ncbi:hypothetical protein V8F33_001287 [Rhypophila sp. PSN 637]
MCFAATCPTCNKKSWRGCGSHLPSVFASIPEDQRCTCEPKVEVDGKKYPPQAKMSLGMPSFLKGWFGGSSKADDRGKKDEL